LKSSGIWKWLRKFRLDDAGNVAVIFAIALPVVVGAASAAIDLASYNMKKSQLQAAADAAAIAGARELAVAGSTKTSIEAAATSFALQELGGGEAYQISVSSSRDDSKVSVSITEDWSPVVGKKLGSAITPIESNATAGLAGATNLCVLALDSSGSGGVKLGTRAKMVGPSCAVYADSIASDGVIVDSGASITADLVCSAGGVKYIPGSIAPEPTTDCKAIADPLVSRPNPDFAGCTFTNKRVGAGIVTLMPGVYCGGLDIVGPAVVTFSAGEYIIKDGPFKISGLAFARGKNIGFFLTGDNSVIDFTGGALVEFAGREAGAMAGLLFFEDRSVPAGRQHRINTLVTKELTGTIYLPNGNLKIDPTARIGDKSAYTAIIVNQLELREGPELVLNTNYGATKVPVPSGIRTMADAVLEK
jgi:Flp pilus assembly protein TadG